jgi:uncharacterized protein YjgD (DUF1641 family)
MADVMQAMKKGKATENVPMLDILQQDAEQRNVDFDALYQMLSEDIQAGKTRIMRSGNTLLIYDILQPGVAEVHISTVDDATKLVSALQDLYQAMKKANFKLLTAVTDNANISRAVSAAKIPVSVKQVPFPEGTPQYQLTIQVQ